MSTEDKSKGAIPKKIKIFKDKADEAEYWKALARSYHREARRASDSELQLKVDKEELRLQNEQLRRDFQQLHLARTADASGPGVGLETSRRSTRQGHKE